jgi:NAD(P)-dependent dehydrogenase (short-subunit alcohol dehydrogenase family)
MTSSDLITTPFSRSSTAAEVAADVDLSGKRAIVTGASSGIGVETARVLASRGAEVTLAVRNVDAGQRVAQQITADTGNDKVYVGALELADRASVTAFTNAFDGPLHILINNAGVMAEPLSRTPEGWEHQFATNHLGHFGLATGLHASLAAASGARIVSLSSTGHFYSPIVFDDIQFETREYDPWQGYGQSKTANVLFAVEAARRWAADGITANAVMPGGIRTELQRHVKDQPGWADIDANYQWKTTEQGAATSILLAVSPLLDGVGGRYFEDCNESGIIDPAEGISAQHGVAAWAVDPADAARLWDVSIALLDS